MRGFLLSPTFICAPLWLAGFKDWPHGAPFDFAQGGNTVNLGLRVWQASGQWGPSMNLTGLGYAEAAVNDAAFGPQATNDE